MNDEVQWARICCGLGGEALPLSPGQPQKCVEGYLSVYGYDIAMGPAVANFLGVAWLRGGPGWLV